MSEIPKLIGADHATFNYLAPGVPRAIVVASHEPADHGVREETFAKLMGRHPVLRNFLASGDGTAHLISDFLSTREFHALPLYQRFYREMRYEDQLSCVLLPPGEETVALSLARDRRSFTERDRQLLNALRPHAARAYRRCEQIWRLTHALRDGRSSTDRQMTSVLLDARNRPVQLGTHAAEWLARFFPGAAAERARLPDAIVRWLQRRQQNRLRRHCDVLVFEHAGERLWLRIEPGPTVPTCRLVLELETRPSAPGSRRVDDLTRREIEVLLEVEQGRTNEAIAAELGISALTVRTHLEHVFDKLGVCNRTAAVIAFRHRRSQHAVRRAVNGSGEHLVPGIGAPMG